MKTKNFAGAIAVAAVLALPLIKPVVFHVETWKIVLGLAGLIIFVRAGMSS